MHCIALRPDEGADEEVEEVVDAEGEEDGEQQEDTVHDHPGGTRHTEHNIHRGDKSAFLFTAVHWHILRAKSVPQRA